MAARCVVLQCAECRMIVGDTSMDDEGENGSGEAAGVEVSHIANYESVRGRIKCEACKETIGTEDEEGRIFLQPSKVMRYVVQSSKPPPPASSSSAASSSSSSSSKRHRMGVVSQEEFATFQRAYDKDMSDCKETIMVLFEQLEALRRH